MSEDTVLQDSQAVSSCDTIFHVILVGYASVKAQMLEEESRFGVGPD